MSGRVWSRGGATKQRGFKVDMTPGLTGCYSRERTHTWSDKILSTWINLNTVLGTHTKYYSSLVNSPQSDTKMCGRLRFVALVWCPLSIGKWIRQVVYSSGPSISRQSYLFPFKQIWLIWCNFISSIYYMEYIDRPWHIASFFLTTIWDGSAWKNLSEYNFSFWYKHSIQSSRAFQEHGNRYRGQYS